MYGWTGKILHIDLSNKSFHVETLSIDIYKKYIGGKGLAGYYLKKVIMLPYDSPKMPLLFFTGPLTGTLSPTSSRFTIMSRSPLTDAICDTSVGGNLGIQIKKAGYDGIVITGKGNLLSGIKITDEKVEFIDVEILYKLDVNEVYSKLEDCGSCAVIGSAAENGVLFSNIIVDKHHFSGRGGLGLVMAEKKLKYLQVTGSGVISVYDKEEILKSREKIFRLTAASPILQGKLGISENGTGALLDLINSRHMLPTNNFKDTLYCNASNVNADKYKKRYNTKKFGCPSCHILCKKAGIKKEIIPEFETMSHFTALIGNTDIDAVVEANRICNDTGMDTITAGATISCYSEISGKKITPKLFIKLLNDIANDRGVGSELKFGSYRYAKSLNKEHLSMTVKKMELPAYDPRGAYGMALSYATSTRGGCHLRAYPISHEILRKPVATDRFTFNGKARIIKISEDINAIIDSLIACKFLFFAASLEEYAQSFYGVTGIEMPAQDLLKVGERIYYNEKIMNCENGFSCNDDFLPSRFYDEDGTSGDGIIINSINKEDFLKARSNYYKIRGLSSDGLTLDRKIDELGLNS